MTPEGRFPVRLVALDLDGTLILEDFSIGDRTKRAVRAALDDGVVVAIATGRMASSARRFAAELGLTAPLIAYQGALIREMWAEGAGPGTATASAADPRQAEPGDEDRARSRAREGFDPSVGDRPAADPPDRPEPLGRIRVHTPLAADLAREVVVWGRERGLDPHVNHLERFILRADDPNAEDYSRFLGARAEFVPDLLAAITHPVTKIIASGGDDATLAALAAGRERFAGRVAVTMSHPHYLEFLAPGVSKGRAVRWLARRSGVPLEQAMAIGDQHNDTEMLQAV
ncbi:MAG TPA: HAD hydrolase family protein, partial [Candidatus Binatia bacterium]|nr:HAD hydrolase family protein [Candidatus Binatia bacterium]